MRCTWSHRRPLKKGKLDEAILKAIGVEDSKLLDGLYRQLVVELDRTDVDSDAESSEE